MKAKRKAVRTWSSSVNHGTFSGSFKTRIGKTGLELTIAPAWNSRGRMVREFKSRKALVDAVMEAIDRINSKGL
jgi:predicted ABC-class ATPase